jgi:hypothetical protein
LTNYTISYVNGSLTVSPAPLTIAANNRTKIYGQTTTFAGTEFTATGLQNSEAIGSVSFTSAGAAPTASVAGSPYAIVPGPAAGGTFAPANYAITWVNGALSVTPAPLTIAANNTNKVFGQSINFAGNEFGSAGLQNSETVGSVTLTSAGAAAVAPLTGSPYAIVPSAPAGGTFAAANYAITFVNGTLTVAAQPQLVLTLSGANYILTFPTLANESYQIQSATSLASMKWSALGGAIKGTGGPVSITNLMPASSSVFYRLQIQF